MKDELQDYLDRPKKYDNIDGTGEMFMGLMLLGFALVGYLQTILQEHSMRGHGFFRFLFSSVGLMYAVLIPVLGLGFVLRRIIKKHITWPRTGYVVYNPDRKTFRKNIFKSAGRGAIFGAVFGIGFAFLLVLVKNHPGVLSFGRVFYLGFWLPIYAFWVYRMCRDQPWKWLVLLFMAMGLFVIGFVVPGNFSALARPAVLFVGLMWFISGAGTLLSYLRHTRPPVEEME